jgi:C_GCAxxG_C_C family probable redox protein
MNSRIKQSDIVLPQGDDWISRAKEKALTNMKQYESCTQSIIAPFMEEFGIKNPMVMRSAGAMFGGMVSSLTCGIHTAGLMVLGLLMGRENIDKGMDGLFPIVLPAQELIRRLNKRLGSHSCKELTGVDFTDLSQAMEFYSSKGHEICISRVAEGAEEIALFLKKLNDKGEIYRFGKHAE